MKKFFCNLKALKVSTQPLILIFTMLLGICVEAETSNHVDSIPSNATEKIFEMLVRTDTSEAKLTAPMEIRVENIICKIGSGSPKKFVCSAKFLKKEQKEIAGDNNIFFQYLFDRNAIALVEMVKGSSTYKAESITCRYALNQLPYFSCVSEVSVKF